MTADALKGKTAVVTGGSRGIGWHIAAALCRAGAEVIITGRSEQTLAEAVRRLKDEGAVSPESSGAGPHFVVCDQRDPEAVAALARQVTERFGAPDVLVNNAGLYKGGHVVDMPLATWNEVIETNLTGVFLTTQAFLPGMIARNRGDIFLISSMSGKKGDPGAAAYAASKFGLQGFAQSLTHEVRRHNIRVMVLNPSSVNTGADTGPREGPGLYLHAADLGALIVALAALPGRTLVRDMDIWGTNPFK
ncbi:MAG: 3-ketoacyl-ACP reductase [Candidatus Sumerlaeia bacterium]